MNVSGVAGPAPLAADQERTAFAVRRTAKDLWISFSLAFFLFYDRLRGFTSAANRLELAWTPKDVLVVYTAAAGLGVAFFAGWKLFSRAKIPRAIIDRLFVLVAVFVVGHAIASFVINDIVMRSVGALKDPFDFGQFGEINYYGSLWTGLLRGIFIVPLLFGLTVGNRPVKKALLALIFVLSPIALVYPLGIISYASVPMKIGSLPGALTVPSVPGRRIFFFLFDEWDYKNTFHNPLGPLSLPGVEEASRDATLYHEAITASALTGTSVPQILTGSPHGGDTIFERAKRAGWRTSIVAGYMPYQIWYGTSADYCLRVEWTKMLPLFPDRLAYELRSAFLSTLTFWTSPDTAERLLSQEAVRSHRHLIDAVQRSSLDVIRHATGPGLYYFHYPVPHWPFLADPDLRRKGLSVRERQVAGYRHNVEAMDLCLQGLVAALKETHQWDDSLVILTGDHGWREDPIRPRPLVENRHTVLFVKQPGQNVHRDVTERYDVRNLAALIQSEIDGSTATPADGEKKK